MPRQLSTVIALVIASAAFLFHPTTGFAQTGEDSAAEEAIDGAGDRPDEDPDEDPERGPEDDLGDEDAESGMKDLEAARLARDEGRFSEALDAISRAQLSDPDNGLFIYERVLILEAMEEYDLALKLIADRRESLIKHPEVNDLVVVEERINRKSQASTDGNGHVEGTEGGGEADKSGETFPVLGTVLTGTGAVFVTASAIVFFIQSGARAELDDCSIEDPDCAPNEFDRRLERANSLRTVASIGGAVGIGLVGWGLYELFTHERVEESDSDKEVSLSPYIGAEGGGIILEATF